MRKKLLWATIPLLMFLGVITTASSAAAHACGDMIGPEDGGTFATRDACVQQGEWAFSHGAMDCWWCAPVPYNGGLGYKLLLFYEP
jgi:hypothetical protein